MRSGKAFQLGEAISLHSRSGNNDGCSTIPFQWINPGAFVMGSPKDEKGRADSSDCIEDQFMVTLTHGYWIGIYPITQAQFNDYVISEDTAPFPMMNSLFQGLPDSDGRPVDSVTWHEAIRFCGYLTRVNKHILPEGYIVSLPWESQWEHACRAGSATRYYNGDSEHCLDQIAWYASNSGGTTHPVGMKMPNAWGLFDMLGNVAQWCYDSFGDYPGSPEVDWVRDDGGPVVRTVRGGDWRSAYDSTLLRCASRLDVPPDTSAPTLGFRACIRCG